LKEQEKVRAVKGDNDLSSTQASLTAGIIGAVMVVLVCFGAAFVFSEPAGTSVGAQLHSVSAKTDVN